MESDDPEEEEVPNAPPATNEQLRILRVTVINISVHVHTTEFVL